MIFSSDSAFSDIGQVAVVTAVTSTSVTVVAEIYTNKSQHAGFTAGSTVLTVTGNGHVNPWGKNHPDIEWINPTRISPGVTVNWNANGNLELFTTGTGGVVYHTGQTSPNGATRWSGWAALV